MTNRFRMLVALATASVLGVAVPTAATAADHCDDLMATSRSLNANLTAATEAMRVKDKVRMKDLLPVLERQFDALPAVEIVPEVCADHVNVYTTLQFTELTTLKARGLPTGFPTQLPIVKQPDLNQALLAYTVGWIKFELGDFAGAKAVFAKGLKIYPHDPNLQSEYMATLLTLKDGGGAAAFAQQVLADTPNLTDDQLAKTYRVLGVAYQLQNDLPAAKDALLVAQKYAWDEDAETILKQLDAASR